MAAEGHLFDASLVADQLMQADLAHRSLSRMLIASSQNDVVSKIQSINRGRSENVTKSVKPENSPTKGTKMEAGTPSTKPASSATNSTNRATLVSAKKELEAKLKTPIKTDNGKRRVQIYFPDDNPEMYKGHKINKAIHLINNIIRLIFKNNKDSLALTTSNGSSSLAPNSVIDVARITEL
jgi:regulatory protein YycI of two-component signal transduction system YycFG